MNSHLEQKTLHFKLYNLGHSGMCNLFMSIQNAVIIASLTGREHIIFYANCDIFNSLKKLSMFDLFDIQYSYSLENSADYPIDLLELPAFNRCCFYHTDIPRASFINNRQSLDLAQLWDVNAFGTDKMTLGYYSYLFFLRDDLRDDLVMFVKDAVSPKPMYLDHARSFQEKLSSYQSVHFRRGDCLTVPGTRNAEVTWDEMMPNLSTQLDKDVLTLIHSDETDEGYFQPLLDAGYQLRFFEKELPGELDDAEKGLVSLLLATGAKKFIGTMLSTFSGIIHQYRRQHGDYSAFKYLYSQIATVTLKDAEISPSFNVNGEYSWNRIELSEDGKNTLSFMMEHPECYPNQDVNIDCSIKIHPNFLSDEEINYFTGVFQKSFSDQHVNQMEHRAIIYIDQDRMLSDVVQRIVNKPGMQGEIFGNAMQVCKQFEEGVSALHSDSLASNTGELRHNRVLLYLNDDYAGGCLEFPYLHTRISPSKGMMICYPVVSKYGEKMPRFSHSSSIITRGSKLVCYLASRH